ncbi:hypothetical protein LJC32_03105 [Oscillospiraceae bacterium OttesenSCG-928-F05]|nr:hypothetical protein [Oscillospiraceae bacterium OttesenSCG-928-F05]
MSGNLNRPERPGAALNDLCGQADFRRAMLHSLNNMMMQKGVIDPSDFSKIETMINRK